MISIAGVEFERRPGCAYKWNYELGMENAKKGNVGTGEIVTPERAELSMIRAFILDDLWFVVYFVMGIKAANHPFWVSACREVEKGPQDFTLDVWSREHGKSSTITKAETIQFALKYPEKSTGIFSAVRPLAKKFLFEIKETFQTSLILQSCFPDVVWRDCEKEAPLWSLDEGLILRRKTNMAEPTISAWGLTEGMPTGLHLDRRIYDDIVNKDISESVDVMEKVKEKYDLSQYLGKDGGTHRVVGTFYHHNDPLTYIRDKKTVSGEPKYLLRLKPATHDGTANGVPVLLSQKSLDDKKGDAGFNTQMLCNPTPTESMLLRFEFMNRVNRAFMPRGRFRMMLIDQAGDRDSNVKKEGGDSWAIAIIGIEPKKDDIGQSNRFLEDLWVQPANESEAIDQAVRMFTRGGIIHKLGVEKVGTTTTHLHIAAALKARGRHVEFGDARYSVGILLRPAGRNKKKFIEGALSWPLNNGKWHYADDIENAYLERLRMEMVNFPVWHDDALNVLAYSEDVIKDCNLEHYDVENVPRSVTEVLDNMPEARYFA